MKRLIHILLVALPALPILIGCDKPIDPLQKPEYNLTVSESSLYFGCESAQELTLTVNSDQSWTIEGISDGVKRWLEVEYTGEEGTSTVTVRCIEANPFDEKRIAMLDFMVEGKVKQTVIISQYSDPERTINLSHDRLEFAAAAGEEQTLSVITNKEWKIEGYTDELASWVEVTPTSGVGVTEVKVRMLSPGSEYENRTAELGFRIDRVHCAYLSIFQKTSSEIKLSSDFVVLKNRADDSATIQVISTSSVFEWHVEGYSEDIQQWLSIQPLEGLGTQDVKFSTIQDNESDTQRSASLRFRLTDNLYADIVVVQEAFESEVQLWADGPEWATRNLGAEKPWIYGDYYAWAAGEPMYKSIEYGDPSEGGYTPVVTWGKILAEFGVEEGAKYNAKATFDGFKIKNAPYSTTSSYNKYNVNDGLDMVSENDDAAHVMLGAEWKIPTLQDWQQLYSQCDWIWMESGNSEYNGVAGYKVQGKGDFSDKSIFIPAAGYFVNAAQKSCTTNGYYWSSNLHTDILKAWRPTFDSSKVTIKGSTNRCYGLPIRPVKND